jgi:microcystin-dependent protein
MSNPFVAEIRIFPFNFAPVGWAMCNGQLLPISQNTALFSLLGTNFGGDGKSTFGLPNFQGSVPIGWGQGPGLSVRSVGESGGAATVTLLQTELPSHAHTLVATTTTGTTATSNANQLALASAGGSKQSAGSVAVFYSSAGVNTALAPNAIGISGQSVPHNNMMPYLGLNFCIALQGVFPARN